MRSVHVSVRGKVYEHGGFEKAWERKGERNVRNNQGDESGVRANVCECVGRLRRENGRSIDSLYESDLLKGFRDAKKQTDY